MLIARHQKPSVVSVLARLRSYRFASVLAGCVFSMSAGLIPFAPAMAVAQAEEVQTFSNPARLVAVGGALTEIIYALGEESKLIARDQTSTYPEAVKKLPDVGYMRNLSAEGVLSVAPTAMLVVEGSGPPETMEVLKRASVPMIIVPEVYSEQGILNKITAVGQALGVQEKAAVLAEKVRVDLEVVKTATANITEKKRVLFILSRQGGRLMVSGQGTAADGMIKMAGGINAINEFNGYKQMTDEALDKAAPDLILLMNTGTDKAMDDHSQLLSNLALAATPAGRNKAVLAMDGLYLLGFGPRAAEAARDLSEGLYGKAAQ
ncbi:heme/hemin ABC transporter substrate-binding protein [Pseudochrobactrum sp. MP213Fo]|uniref:heme/hemin ABC transporter substrate-binding protein n=1 Tax=Pseudochrobactrum sp. MP213Fo TaxID=3022250 RepID=UPI003BA2D311